MSIRAVFRAWTQFFFTPQPPTPIALFRILYGLLTIADLILLRPDWLDWYGAHAWISLATMHKLEPGVRLNLFTLMPSGDLWAHAFFWVFLAAAVLLTVGLATRLSSVVVFLCLVSMHERNLYILHSGDAFMRVAGFFLMFAPAGAAFSLDRWIRVRRKGGHGIQLDRPWAQRMIQFNMALFYFTACWWKSLGADWVNGSAAYYVIHLDQLLRFPLPASFGSPFFGKLATWWTLALEFSLGVLVWFRETRYPVLMLGILFHLSLEYALNVPLFQWDLLSAYVLFIDPADLTSAWTWVRSRALVKSGYSTTHRQ